MKLNAKYGKRVPSKAGTPSSINHIVAYLTVIKQQKITIWRLFYAKFVINSGCS